MPLTFPETELKKKPRLDEFPFPSAGVLSGPGPAVSEAATATGSSSFD